jgi:GTP-binding protein
MLPVIAIVGRPNVGKSALFNRIVGKRIAIVHDQPGITRDRIAAEAEHHGAPFTLLDTGGIGLLRGEQTHDEIIGAMRHQADIAIADAALILLVVDSRDGVVPLDHEVAKLLRESGKAIFLAVNKVDNLQQESLLADFMQLGFEKIFPVSAIQGLGMDEMLDEAIKRLPATVESDIRDQESEIRNPLKIAVVGRPNVGKSSLINRLVHEERVIVSEVAGTTRDAVDVPFTAEIEGRQREFVLIDTAGIRPTGKVDTSVEFFSVRRAEQSIERCELAVLVLDASMGVTAQDKKIGGKILAANKGCIIAVNKWDLVGERVQTQFIEQLHHILFFLDFAPVVFISAKTGMALGRLLSTIHAVDRQLNQEVPTAVLNRVLSEAIRSRPSPSKSGHQLRLYYATQTGTRPPRFLVFVNTPDLFSDSYRKYICDRLRAAFGFEGCSLVLSARAREHKIEPKRSSPNRKPSRIARVQDKQRHRKHRRRS